MILDVLLGWVVLSVVFACGFCLGAVMAHGAALDRACERELR